MANILIIGAGDIGYPLALTLSSLFDGSIYVTRNDKSKGFNGLEKTCTCGYDNVKFVKNADVIILAVRPAQLAGVLTEITPYLTEDKVLISIAACKKTELIRDIVGPNVQIARAMPNVGLSFQKSMTFLCFDSKNTNTNFDSASMVFSFLGEIEIISEEMMNAGTIFSGSMPAIMAKLFSSCGESPEVYMNDGCSENIRTIKNILTEITLENGFENAKEIIDQVYDGLYQISRIGGKSFEEVIHEVATPGGCTQAMLDKIDRDEWLRAGFADNHREIWKKMLRDVIGAGIERLGKM
ncbi:MAG: NAD(P)-binding domain-containing protein [Candidatus Paceibacterota bacterium]